MSNDVAKRLGIFVERDVLDAQRCASLREEMASAATNPAKIGSGGVVYREIRNTLRVSVRSETARAITALLDEHRVRISAHFARPADFVEEPQFLIYDTGGYYREHVDVGGEAPGEPGRQIATVLFLGDEHRGGELVIYGMMGDPPFDRVGIPIVAEPGLLVAFPADRLHEVKPVTEGRRFTIASWLTRAV